MIFRILIASSLVYFAFPNLFQLAVNPRDYPRLVGGRCGLHFDCDINSPRPLCVPLSAVRDCVPDCPNGSDEACGSGQILCDLDIPDTPCGRCVPDGERDRMCLDRKWQHLCNEAGVVPCNKTQNCVFEKWLNDGQNDCGDNSDEDPCNTGLLDCSSTTSDTQSTIRTSTERTTVTGNRSTTEQTQKPGIEPPTKPCPAGDFLCISGECINPTKVFDGAKDCKDGSDEDYCSRDETRACPAQRPCSFQADIASFGCGCPSGWIRSEKAVCRPERAFGDPVNCAHLLLQYPRIKSGVYKLTRPRCISEDCTYEVYCEMDLNKGGWTRIMQRNISSKENPLDFNRTFQDYCSGFGDAKGEFWLGNVLLHDLTGYPIECTYELLVFAQLSKERRRIKAKYKSFSVGSLSDKFRLSLGMLLKENENFTDVDHLASARNMPFQMFDTSKGTCQIRSGWWSNDIECGSQSLTAPWKACNQWPGLHWGQERITTISLLIRPRGFESPRDRDENQYADYYWQ